VPLVLFNKPYLVLSQFRDPAGRKTLADYVRIPGIYPAGRLDRDSEGLLLLTDDGRLQARIAEPREKLCKHYCVQVDGLAEPAQLEQLHQEVILKDGPARAIAATVIETPDWLWPRDPPIRVRLNSPTSWIDVLIDEGRNRQVRRMTAAVGLPTLRLIRHRIGPWSLAGLLPGATRIIDTFDAWENLANYDR
jgi:23S rRNA pseudouridine2457 synthase